jgi:hypothetical protein
MKTIIYVCSTHFLNTIRKKTKTIILKNDDAKVRKAFLFCFGLVQNSTSLDQIKLYITHIYNIFNSQFVDDSVVQSLNFIKEEIELRDWIEEDNDYNNKNNQNKKRNQENTDNCKYYIKCESNNDVFNSSPFRTYFEDFFKELRQKSLTENLKTKQNKVKNEYFFPGLITLIEKQMYIIPLWTGLMLKVFQTYNTFPFSDNFTRLTNNPAEGRFNILKNNIFKKERKKKRRLMLSQITSRLLLDVKATYKKHIFKR